MTSPSSSNSSAASHSSNGTTPLTPAASAAPDGRTTIGPLAPSRASSGWIRSTVYTALFAALFVAFSAIQLPLGFTSVPITLQALAVMLAGGLLGARYGFWSIAIVVLLTTAGLPLLSGHGGLATVFGFTGGFIWMFPFEALLIGWVSDRLFRDGKRFGPVQYALLFAGIFVFGIVLAYIGGVPWYAYKAELSVHAAMIGACYPFLPGDILKGIVATLAIGALRPVVPGFRRIRR
ncbi:biotin transporter BioY [Cohnella nanjingensis]|uniref:Biotin transporter BioY n=1 Tax=Cohnella nanjingensis TaxID=1387779 RepID=A0A7X0RUN9_9BACL|nr:biotin transporter BioY [Cohnella nanjingensis]MBB6672826.1 biotin transporter BioY [Cohnella nanjingensis]